MSSVQTPEPKRPGGWYEEPHWMEAPKDLHEIAEENPDVMEIIKEQLKSMIDECKDPKAVIFCITEIEPRGSNIYKDLESEIRSMV